MSRPEAGARSEQEDRPGGAALPDVPLLERYLEDLHAGRRPDRAALLAQRPDLAGLLDCLESLHALVPAAAAPEPAAPEEAQTLSPSQVGTELAPAGEFPRRFGKYELLGELGRGGMGVVYKARQLDLDRVVAVKMILASSLASPDQVRRFVAEARAAARLHHPHIVQIHEVGEQNGQHFFAMEFVEGQSLADRLRAGPLPPEAAARCLRDVARAVEHLHQHGIVHRDLKPANILLDGRFSVFDFRLEDNEAGAKGSAIQNRQSKIENPLGNPKIADFGLAKIREGEAALTSTGVIVGTPSYMAPEQAAGRNEQVGPVSDVYALGAILYELLTGRPPFRESTPLDTLVQVLEGEPVPPRQLAPAVPRDLELVCLKCLEKRPEDRYQSAAAVADDLDRFLGGEGVEARPYRLGQRLQRWTRREPALASRLAGLAVLIGILQVQYYVVQDVSLPVHLLVQSLMGVLALVAVAAQALLRSGGPAVPVRCAWLAADLLLFTAILKVTGNHNTPVLIAYPAMIVASGLWFDVRIVWFTTAMAALAYGLLVLDSYPNDSLHQSPHHPAIFVVALAVIGFIVAYQVQRVRVLSRYYDHRPLG
jgi:serine/threonine-protein kinase